MQISPRRRGDRGGSTRWRCWRQVAASSPRSFSGRGLRRMGLTSVCVARFSLPRAPLLQGERGGDAAYFHQHLQRVEPPRSPRLRGEICMKEPDISTNSADSQPSPRIRQAPRHVSAAFRHSAAGPGLTIAAWGGPDSTTPGVEPVSGRAVCSGSAVRYSADEVPRTARGGMARMRCRAPPQTWVQACAWGPRPRSRVPIFLHALREVACQAGLLTS